MLERDREFLYKHSLKRIRISDFSHCNSIAGLLRKYMYVLCVRTKSFSKNNGLQYHKIAI